MIPDEPQCARVLLGVRENYYADEEIKEWIKNGKIREFILKIFDFRTKRSKILVYTKVINVRTFRTFSINDHTDEYS